MPYGDFAKRDYFLDDDTEKNKINIEWWLRPSQTSARQWVLPARSTNWILRKRTEI